MFTLAITDLRWHRLLLDEAYKGTVNFWTPTLWRPQLEPGSRLFFMLKSPVRKIGGFGYVAGYQEHTVDVAWTKFGRGNGVASEEDLRNRVDGFAARRAQREREPDSPIGCILLEDAVFLPDEFQLSPEELGLEFAPQIVTYKRFRGDLQLPVEAMMPMRSDFVPLLPDAVPTIESRDTKARPDQALFRSSVLRAYEHRCAVTGTPAVEVLDAAHIQPHVNRESDHIQNGVALRKDIHALFDAGLISIAEDFTIKVSPQLQGKSYQALNGRPLRRPANPAYWPSLLALAIQRVGFRGAGLGP